MVDASANGRTGGEFPMVVELGKIREFAAATGSENPAYRTADRPVSPATFLTTAAFWHTDDSDPWPHVRMNPRRGLHAEQEFVFHGPPPAAGDRLVCRSRIADVYQKTSRRGGTLTFAVMVTEFRDADGRLVAEARSTGVETSQPVEQP
ncbi:MaoC family dehydratase N-terminal domain-containing protein [Micromonospora sp. NBRC 101691]|uniref:FAS1-like dehydratase domain-containing protein n=1 Tax=Micromonospora sp. NBRC 101691 TaxID=3032198 RepID=UPI00249FFAC4|nr:MaoC family dehydratase N-terminal domain-containing protein [Micromonospora sp. NBRC 101691]GLY24627.1 hypothetical protein Misp04_43590 [Micromonospora sp. NBRC 101691]